ncbi:MAG: hypothetical protein GX562_04085 [Coriobacteriaceae bacterium]|nr:hypothetical protein [Coriobacteriaceae bacterium]
MSIAVILIGVASAFISTLAVLCWHAIKVTRQDEYYVQNRSASIKKPEVSRRALLGIVVIFAICLLILNPRVSIVALVVVGSSALTVRRVILRNKAAAFDRQLQNALPMVAQNLRAGQTIQTALSSVGECMSDPLKRELARVNTEVTLAGMPLDTALESLARRTDSQDVAFLATTIGVQKVGGGKMAELIDTVAARITRRQALRRHIKAVTAQARLVSKIIACAPITVLAMLVSGSSEIARTFWDSSVWPLVILVVLILDAVGLLFVRHIYSMPMD